MAKGLRLASGLSAAQREIWFLKSELVTYDAVIAKYRFHDPQNDVYLPLSGHQTLRTCLHRTAFGLFWEPRMTGRPSPLLCDEDMSHFLSIVETRCDDLNCITTTEAKRIVAVLRKKRVEMAGELLEWVGCHDMASQTLELLHRDRFIPTSSWVTQACRRLGICVMKPEELEKARRNYCNNAAIQLFFDKFSDFLVRPPELILNADETQLSSRRLFKVLTKAGMPPITEKEDPLPHFTAMITVAPAGQYRLRPVVILPKTQTCPLELQQFREQIYFLRSSEGWMTKECFLLWVHCLLHELEIYKMSIPHRHRSGRFLLLLDGHGSRRSWEAIQLLESHGVDVVIFPAHCTHVLQPFDVAVASPLKTAFASEFLTKKHSLDGEAIQGGSKISQLRRVIFQSFWTAFEKALVTDIIRAGFRATGIYPLDRSVPLRNPLARRTTSPSTLFAADRREGPSINCQILTNQTGLQFLLENGGIVFHHEGRPITDKGEQWLLLTTRHTENGDFLMGPESFEFEKISACAIAAQNRLHLSVLASDLLGSDAPQTCFFQAESCSAEDFLAIAAKLISMRVIVIVDNSHEVEKFGDRLVKEGIPALTGHGRMKQSLRIERYHQFAAGVGSFFIVTSVFLLGIVPFGADVIFFAGDNALEVSRSPRFDAWHQIIRLKSEQDQKKLLDRRPLAMQVHFSE